jgi:diguanylate cyclase (GGDEF)-like protein/PAS domain S-box-containing protein
VAHPLLARQMKKLGLGDDAPPPDAEVWRRFLDRLDRSYIEADQDRYLLERSLAMSSREMQELYESLRESSETRIAAERNRLRAVISSLGAGLCILDPEARVLSINPEGERLLGWQEAELSGGVLCEFVDAEGPHGLPYERLDTCLRNLMTSGGPNANQDACFTRKDGTDLPVSYVLTPITEEDRLLGVVLVFLDITERKHAEAALREAHDELEARVQERTLALAEANEVLQVEIAERKWAEEALRRQNQYFAALHETALALMNRLEIDDLLSALITRAGQLLGTPHGFVYLLEPGDAEIQVKVGIGCFSRHVGFRVKPGEGLAGLVWQTGKPVVVTDYDAWEGRSPNFPHGEVCAVAAVPLRSGTRVVGVIGVQREQAGTTYGDSEVELLNGIAQLVSIALDNARLYSTAQRDLDERRRAEEALRWSEQRFRSLVQNASDIIAILDADGVMGYLSPGVQPVLGYAPDGLAGVNVFEMIHPDDVDRLRTAWSRVVLQPGLYPPIEFRFRHADGSWRHLEASANNLLHDPSVGGVVENVRDITEQKLLEEQLTHRAFYDPLTDLPNRALFMDRLTHALAATAGHRREAIAVLFLDLDGFKVINDSMGHGAGDALLSAVARRLMACLRLSDTIARFGGDEFAVLIEDVSGPGEAFRTAERILEKLRRPFDLEGREVFVTASIGIALSSLTVSGARPDDLLREADIALYQAKAVGKARAVIFDPSMNARAVERLEMETDLRLAIERGEFRVYYQPMVLLETGAIGEVEALVRWQHPKRGLLSPSDFIPLAEETGLIVPIGRWVLVEACHQVRQWREQYPAAAAIVLSVNLSPRQFQQPDLVAQVAGVLAETGLGPEGVRLEITESLLMEDAPTTVHTLCALKDLGVHLAIDDFGTGYSSLSYLSRFPVDTLKIDRSFVTVLDTDDENALAIVRAVTTLGHALGMEVTAEGIETARHLVSVRDVGCDRGQGYFFAHPVPADAMADILVVGLTAVAVAAGSDAA